MMTTTNTPRQAIVILGMHRAGTSLCARIFELLGATAAKTLMPAKADNSNGFWESLPIMRFNEGLLRQAIRGWDKPQAIADSWLNASERSADIAKIVELIQAEFADNAFLVLKEPRFARLLPLWLQAFQILNIQPLFIICCRHPQAVTASLQTRETEMSAQQAASLWLAHMLDAERYSRAYPRAVIHYETLLKDWRTVISQAYKQLGWNSFVITATVAKAINAYLDPQQQHHAVDIRAKFKPHLFSQILTETYAIYQQKQLNSNKIALDKLYTEWQQLTASLVVKPKQKRTVILHYHLFKNAGTSLDAAFKANFKGNEWITAEFPPNLIQNRLQVKNWILDNPQAKCFSSHTASLPPPQIPEVKILPVIFVRNPLDRIVSAYTFEKKQHNATTFGSIVAQNTNIAGYIAIRLAILADRQCRNFHLQRLAVMFGEKHGDELTRAQQALATLPFVGIVEEYAVALEKLQLWLRQQGFTDLKMQASAKNVSQDKKMSLEQKMLRLQAELGDKLYAELLVANQADLDLHAIASAKLANFMESS